MKNERLRERFAELSTPLVADAALRLKAECAAALAERGNARRLLGDLDKALTDCDDAVWNDVVIKLAG